MFRFTKNPNDFSRLSGETIAQAIQQYFNIFLLLSYSDRSLLVCLTTTEKAGEKKSIVQQITPQAGEKENIPWKSGWEYFFQFNLSWDIVWIFSNQSKMQTE